MRVRAYILLLAPACGYDVTPVVFDVETTASSGVRLLSERGTADPAGSEFDEGMMLSARWKAPEGAAASAELWIDLNRAGLPETITPPERPRTLATDNSLRIAVSLRDVQGKLVVRQEASSVLLSMYALAPHDARYLSSGWFEASFADPDGVYTALRGTWQTVPPPSSLSPELPDVEPGDTAGDPAGGDTAPPREDTAAQDEGCGCGGGGDDGGTGDHDGGDPEPGDDDGSEDGDADETYEGCGCGGDESDDSGGPQEGCGCEGDTTEEPDPDESSSSDSGCCSGDPEPEPEPQAGVTGSLSAPRPGHRCYKSPLRHTLAVSPLLAFYVFVQRRRRNGDPPRRDRTTRASS